MHFHEVIVTQGFCHIFERILLLLDAKSIVACRQTCQAWHDFISNDHQDIRFWKCVVKKIRFKRVLIHPKWIEVQQEMYLQNDRHVAHVQLKFFGIWVP